MYEKKIVYGIVYGKTKIVYGDFIVYEIVSGEFLVYEIVSRAFFNKVYKKK